MPKDNDQMMNKNRDQSVASKEQQKSKQDNKSRPEERTEYRTRQDQR